MVSSRYSSSSGNSASVSIELAAESSGAESIDGMPPVTAARDDSSVRCSDAWPARRQQRD